MQPFVAVEQIKAAYQSYVETSYPIRNVDLQAQFRHLVETQNLLWQEPFISLSRPPRKGETFSQLIAAGILHPNIVSAHWGFETLWRHQDAATRRLSTVQGHPRNTIVATGTGSGKTESFLIPIVDDCLRHPQPAGVRAIIIYPMNALANDQLDRLRRLLAGTGVSFGLYSGDTPYNDQDAVNKGITRPADSPAEERFTRHEIQTDPPQILLTNHVMLELLLLRKQEQKIFKGVKPRFLVLDEVHTYTGILGAEVACLIRRLKEHTGLQPGELGAIGTSATVLSDDQADSQGRLIEFATELFAEHFDQDAIINEAYEDIIWPESEVSPPPVLTDVDLIGINPEDPAAIRQLAEKALDIPFTSTEESSFEALYQAIAKRRIFAELEEMLAAPRAIPTVIEKFRALPGRQDQTESELKREITALLLLGSAARKPGAADPFDTRYRPKIHQIMRSVAPLNICLEPECGQLLTDGSTDCQHKTSGASGEATKALTLGLCRSCGADYRLGYFTVTDDMMRTPDGKKRKKLELKHAGVINLEADESESERLETLFLYPGTMGELVLEEEGELPVQAVEYVVCPVCLQARHAPAGEAYCENASCGYSGELEKYVAFLRGSRCPVCRAQGRGRRPEIITPLRGGAATSVAVLTQSLFPHLKAENEFHPDEKRVLIFADSRQDTAHQAGYLRDRHQVFTQRQIVYQTLRRHEIEAEEPIPLPQLAQEVFLKTRDAYGEVTTMNLLTAVEDFSTDDVGGFYPEDMPISKNQMNQAIDRLRWDLTVEFTDRATSRYSLEREGLTTVQYARLDDVARQALPEFEAFNIGTAEFLETLLRSLLDMMRIRQAVDFSPFRDFLDSKSTPVFQGKARPTRETRTPVGFARTKQERSGAYKVIGWYNPNNPGAHQTAIYNIITRVLPALAPTEVTHLIDKLVGLLEKRQYILSREIGRLCSGQIHVEVKTGGTMMDYGQPTSSLSTYNTITTEKGIRGLGRHKRNSRSVSKSRGE